MYDIFKTLLFCILFNRIYFITLIKEYLLPWLGITKEHGINWKALSFPKVFAKVFTESNENNCIITGNSLPSPEWYFLTFGFETKNVVLLYRGLGGGVGGVCLSNIEILFIFTYLKWIYNNTHSQTWRLGNRSAFSHLHTLRVDTEYFLRHARSLAQSATGRILLLYGLMSWGRSIKLHYLESISADLKAILI